MIAKERLYLTADRKSVVSESDPNAAFLFAAKGSEISDKDAAKYGLSEAPKAVEVSNPGPTEARESRVVKKITKR